MSFASALLKHCYFSYNARKCSPIETKAVVTLYWLAFGAYTKRYQGYVHTRKDSSYLRAKTIWDRASVHI